MNNIHQSVISIILPAFNEEKAIGKVIDDIWHVMNQTSYSYELFVVDDFSQDRTTEIATAKGIPVIRHYFQRGSGAARKTGIRQAKGDIIVMLDTDGTYDASDIPKMLELFPEADQVIGARTSEKGTLKWLRFPAKWTLRKLASLLTGVPIPDLNSGLKAFKKDIVMKYIWLIPDGFSCVSSITLSFLCNGHHVQWIPTNYFPRIGKSKFHPLKDSYRYFITIIKMIMYFNPLKVFLPTSLLLICLGITKSLYDYFFVIHRLQLSDIIVILSGIIIFMMGLLADLIVVHGKALSEFKKD